LSPAPSSRKLEAAPREVESSVVIVAPDPEHVLRSLTHLRTLDGYRFARTDRRSIVDTYFDTPDAKLRKRGFALRIRVENGMRLITLKGRRSAASGASDNRLELEVPFSLDAIHEIRSRVHLPAGKHSPRERESPEDLLQAELGVEAIQTRETERSARAIAGGDARTAVAELALDRVQFHVGQARVRHYEAELESKQPRSGPKAVRELVPALLRRYPDTLRPWTYSKLATGNAIAELMAKRRLDDVVSPDGTLAPQAYGLIARYLQRNLDALLS
jgi:inorganic triphosphatase YgiF